MSRIQKMQVTNRHDDLLARWMGLWMSQGVLPGRVPDIGRVMTPYEGEDRHYHNLQHIRECLVELDGVRVHAREPALIELAIWFHDVVYDPTRHDNEEQSADVARDVCRQAGMPPGSIDKIMALILATRHAEIPADADAQLLADIDLSNLGRSADAFDAYERAIRLENQHLSSEAFSASRRGVLRRLLDRRQIYATPLFRERYEAAARQNLQRSIDQLTIDTDLT